MQELDLLTNVFMSSAPDVGVFSTTINFILCVGMSFLVRAFYIKYSVSLTGKHHIGVVIPVLSSIVFLIIMVVKSSLALSLGLVGALSIVRFRTPIKEPEDLAFLFLAIGIGIGYGAIQIYATTIIFLIIIIVFWLFLSNKSSKIENDFNLVLETKEANSEEVLDKVIHLFQNNSIDANLFKLEKTDELSLIYFRVSFESIDKMKHILNSLNHEISNLRYTLYEHKVVD